MSAFKMPFLDGEWRMCIYTALNTKKKKDQLKTYYVGIEAKAKLGWNPAKTSFEELVNIMVDSDMAKVASEGAAEKVRTNLAEYLEKGIVK